MQGNDEAVVKLVIDASGLRQGSVEAQALGKRIIDSFKAIETAANQVSGSINVSGAGIVKGLGDTNRFLSQMERGLNPLAAAANKAAVEMNRLMGIMGGSNAAAAQRAGQLLELQAKKVLDLKQALFLASGESDRLGASLNKTVKDAADRLDYLTSKYNQDATAAKNYRNTIKELNEAIDKGAIGYKQLGMETSKAIDAYNKSTTAGQKMAAGTKQLSGEVHQLGLNSRLAAYALTNFSFQINDVVSGVVMGQQPFRIFAQQAGQFVQIFQQIGRENIGQFFRNMRDEVTSLGATFGRWLVTPVGAAVAGLTTLAAGLVVVLTRAVSLDSQIRALGVTLRTLGTNSLISGRGIQNMIPELQEAGLTRSQAGDALQNVIRVQGINPQAAGQIARVGANFAAAFGGEAADAARSFALALTGGVKSAVDFALSVDAISGKEASLMLRNGELGKSMEVLSEIANRVDQRLKGNLLSTLGPFDTVVLKLKNSWDSLLNTLARSTVIEALITGVTKLIDAVDKLFQLKPPVWFSTVLGVMALPFPGAIGAIGGVGAASGLGIVGRTPAASSSIIGSDNIATALTFFQNKGLSGQQSAGIVGRLQAESGMNPAAVNPSSGAFGIAQWLGGREKPLGGSTDLQTQLELIWKEFQTTEAKAFEKILKTFTARDAAIAMESFERAGDTLFTERAARIAEGIANTRLGKDGGVVGDKTINDLEKAKLAVEEYEKALRKQLDVQGQIGLQADLVQAKQNAEALILEKGLVGKEAENALNIARKDVLDKYMVTLDKGIQLQDTNIKGLQDTATALINSTGEGEKARAEAEARNIVTARGALATRAEAEILAEKAQILKRVNAENEIAIRQGINQRGNQGQILQLQTDLVGRTTEETNKQVALLQAQIELRNKNLTSADAIWQAEMKSVAALENQKIILADTQREWQRFESAVINIASTIENTLTSAIKDAFDGNRVKSWGETLKSMMSSILSQIVNFTLIRPAIGTALSLFGMGNASQQFGTFGSGISSLFGGGGGTSGTGLFGSTSSNQTGAGGTLDSLMSAGSVGKGIFDLAGAFGGGGGGGFTSGILEGLFGSVGTNFGGGGAALGVADAIGGFGGAIGSGVETATAGLFGSMPALSGFLGSVIPFIGPIIGIASAVLPMLFSKKPSNFASGGLLTLGAGGGLITGTNSSGNAQNDAGSNQILQGLQSFTKGLLNALPGSSITGNLYTNVGTRDGTIVGGKIGGFSGEMKFGSPQEALNAAQLLVVKSLDGVSDSFKQAAQTLTDPQQVQDFIRFITIYDNLKDAFDSAFSSIDADTKKIGPFETALNQITATFDELTSKANEFGLSLDPINAGLAEAEKRLRIDFVKTMNDAILGFEDPLSLLVQKEKEAGQARLDDAIAIGASLVEVNKVNALQLDAIWDNQTQSLMDLKEELESGALSGLTIGRQVVAANDNFEKVLALVRGGNLGEIANLAPAAQSAFQLSQTAYGNAPQTALLRQGILDAIDKVMLGRSFASGTESTPEGWIRVGEDGPEWMKQNGGNIILPNDRSSLSPFSDGGGRELISELRQVKELLIVSNNIDRGVGVETVRRLDKINEGISKKKLEENMRTKVA